MKNVHKSQDKVIFVHVPEYHTVVQSRKFNTWSWIFLIVIRVEESCDVVFNIGFCQSHDQSYL